MKKKFTTVRIPKDLKKAVYHLIELDDEPLFLIENRAVERFIDEKKDVEERYRYRKYDEKYIKRDQVLPLYLTEGIMQRVDAYRRQIGTSKSNIVLQALENECIYRAEKKGVKIDIAYLEHESQRN